MKEPWQFFDDFLANQNGHPGLDPRTYVLAEVGAVIRERVGERNKKRDRDTEQALAGLNRGTNYGPTLPVSISMLLEHVAQAWLA